jgi:hypothetical protein
MKMETGQSKLIKIKGHPMGVIGRCGGGDNLKPSTALDNYVTDDFRIVDTVCNVFYTHMCIAVICSYD